MRLFPLFIVSLTGARGVHSLQEQIPVVEKTATDTSYAQDAVDDIAPAIGVHFTISYAVAAARYPNGTIQDLVKLEGDAGYIELMSRWAEKSEPWGEDCYSISRRPSELDLRRWRCNKRKVSRFMRSLLGLPISRDAAILSNFLRLLREALTEQLGTPVTSIAPAIFRLDRHQTEDFQASLELAGVASSRPWAWDTWLVFSDVNAAYAGLGYGLCEDGRSYMECYDDLNRMDHPKVLSLTFDSYSFAISLSSLGFVYEEWSTAAYDFHLELGHRNVPDDKLARAEFWLTIHDLIVSRLTRLLVTYSRMGMSAPSTKIVLIGDRVYDNKFYAVVEAAIRNVRDIDVEILAVRSLKEGHQARGMAARGAAELGWRSGYWQRQLAEERKAADARAHEPGSDMRVWVTD